MLDKNSGYLFYSRDLRDLFALRASAIQQELEKLDPNRLLNTSQIDLAKYFVDKYTIHLPSLRRDGWSVDETEVQIDVSKDPNRWDMDRNGPIYIQAQRIEVEVPIDGEIELMYAKASQFSFNPPKAEIRNRSLFIVLVIPQNDVGRNIRNEIDRILAEIDRHLEWTRVDVNGFNQVLPHSIEQAITARRNVVLANQGRVASLGIPLKSISDAPKTYAVPEVRRKVTPSLPQATTAVYQPEPALDENSYNHILSVIQNMTHVMERSPSAFKGMGEEALRQHFLVQLNGHFEGSATGETFNVNGKTDILLRAKDKNIFIAECKFWKGPKHHRETIDQLLSYTAWRDTKTAIIIFNRDTAMSTVLESVAAETTKHHNFKRQVTTFKHESGFQYIFHHNSDSNREFILTILVFDVPSHN